MILNLIVWAANILICGIFWYKYKKAEETRMLLIKQNLIYLVSFTNYFEWVSSSFKPELLKVIAADVPLLEFFKQSGTSIKEFMSKAEGPATTMNALMLEKNNLCLADIKMPLAKEIEQLIGGASNV